MSADTSTAWEDSDQPAVNVRQIGGVRHDIPAAVTSMVGRDRETGELIRLLGEPDVRLVTLTGPGGIGKTRLATAVARGLPGHAAFVPLAAIGATDLIATAIARALRIDLAAGQSAESALRDALAARQLLLVLDNFEHLRDGADLVSDLLAGCPGLTVLATSRIRLGIAGEHVFPVNPLAVPPSSGAIGSTAIESVEAVRLFVDRARAAHPPFVLTDQNAGAVATICRRLDGLPLAIELAAARSNLLSPQALAARLEHRLQVLASGPRDAPERLQTMRSAIAWSVDLLDEREFLLWRRLGAFTGGCTADAAAAVAGLDDEAFLATIASLVDHNLVRITSNVLHEPRFDMLESTREFALERLAAAGEEATARDAHAAWCGRFGSEAEPGLMGPESSIWFDRVEADIANIRGAFEWLIGQGRIEPALDLAGALAWFWSAPNYIAEGRAWFDRMLSLAGDEVDARVRAKALMFAGDLAHWHNANEPAARLIDQALTLAREIGDTEKIAATLRGLASIAIDRMNYVEAESLLKEAHAVVQDVDDPWNVAAIANLLGLALRLQGRYDEAERWHEAALHGWQESGSVDYLPVALHGLATARAGMGQHARAWESIAAALALLDDDEPTTESLTIMTESAQLAVRSDHLVAAIHLFATCARLRKELAVPVRPPEHQRIDAGTARLRHQIGETRFAQEWARGQALSHGEAMAIARSLASASPGSDVALSTREREVLLLLVEGASDPEIADRLFISRRTASKHVAAILEKLGATNRTAAVTTAHRRGLV